MLRTMESKYSRRIGAEVLRRLGLTPSQVDRLKTIPYEQLLAAGEKAVAQVRAEAEKEGISTFIFGWAPTVDGNVLPAQPFDPQAPEQSRDIPLLVGTTLHEFTTSTYVPFFRTVTEEQAVEVLRKKYGERTDEFLAALRKAYPDYQPKDLVDIDFVFRPGAVEQARLKAAQQGAPVYMYLFGWESPVMDGMLRSTHCMEIPFVFDNTERHASIDGRRQRGAGAGRQDERRMAHLRPGTGNPGVGSLPAWEAYTPQSGATMYFDNECRVLNNHDKELLEVVRSFPTRGF